MLAYGVTSCEAEVKLLSASLFGSVDSAASLSIRAKSPRMKLSACSSTLWMDECIGLMPSIENDLAGQAAR
jgi:hypothetical protein